MLSYSNCSAWHLFQIMEKEYTNLPNSVHQPGTVHFDNTHSQLHQYYSHCIVPDHTPFHCMPHLQQLVLDQTNQMFHLQLPAHLKRSHSLITALMRLLLHWLTVTRSVAHVVTHGICILIVPVSVTYWSVCTIHTYLNPSTSE